MWFDEHLTWDRHLSQVMSRARARLWQLLCTVQSEWGLTPDLFMRLVRGAILPALFFGAPVWDFVLRYSTRLAELDDVLALGSDGLSVGSRFFFSWSVLFYICFEFFLDASNSLLESTELL